MKRIKIGNKYIGKSMPVFIIAEIGSNHNQDLETGKKLIDISLKAGVDAVKFQSFTVDNWISKDFKLFPTLTKKQDAYKQLKQCELPYDMYEKLKRYTENKGLICFSSPSHMEDVDRLYRIGVPAFKFGSVQITDLPTIVYAAKKKKPIILSTGASIIVEIKKAVETILSTGNKNIILLHCTSLYPTRIDQVNLNAMITLRNTFGLPVGYSDHTLDPITVPIAAVAMGACVIEKHITLSRKLKGPDHPFAIEPGELKKMVKAIRDTEKALGSGSKKQLPEEKEIVRLGRRSIVAREVISKGTLISKEMLTLKRPGYGIAPEFLSQIVGRKAKIKIKKDHLVSWKTIS